MSCSLVVLFLSSKIIINLFQLDFLIYPTLPLMGAVTSTRTLTLFPLDFSGTPQNWGSGVVILAHIRGTFSIMADIF